MTCYMPWSGAQGRPALQPCPQLVRTEPTQALADGVVVVDARIRVEAASLPMLLAARRW